MMLEAFPGVIVIEETEPIKIYPIKDEDYAFPEFPNVTPQENQSKN